MKTGKITKGMLCYALPIIPNLFFFFSLCDAISSESQPTFLSSGVSTTLTPGLKWPGRVTINDIIST